MKEIDSLTVKIGCKIEVSDQTAENCLKLLEIWQNDNPDKFIEVQRIVTEAGSKTMFTIRGGTTDE